MAVNQAGSDQPSLEVQALFIGLWLVLGSRTHPCDPAVFDTQGRVANHPVGHAWVLHRGDAAVAENAVQCRRSCKFGCVSGDGIC